MYTIYFQRVLRLIWKDAINFPTLIIWQNFRTWVFNLVVAEHSTRREMILITILPIATCDKSAINVVN
jgi:hypothetical protein